MRSPAHGIVTNVRNGLARQEKTMSGNFFRKFSDDQIFEVWHSHGSVLDQQNHRFHWFSLISLIFIDFHWFSPTLVTSRISMVLNQAKNLKKARKIISTFLKRFRNVRFRGGKVAAAVRHDLPSWSAQWISWNPQKSLKINENQWNQWKSMKSMVLLI